MLSLIGEFKKIINEVRKLYADSEIIVCGDLNLPGIRWQHTAENSGNLTPTSATTRAELRFIEEITAHGLFQMNPHPNSRNVFLDLVLSTYMTNFQVVPPMPEELIDNYSAHHNASISIITYDSMEPPSDIKSQRRRKINLPATTKALQNCQFIEPDQADVNETFFSEPLTLGAKIMCITDIYRQIQDSCTTISRHNTNTDAPQHPWTSNKRFQVLWRRRRQLKKIYINDNSEANKLALKIQTSNWPRSIILSRVNTTTKSSGRYISTEATGESFIISSKLSDLLAPKCQRQCYTRKYFITAAIGSQQCVTFSSHASANPQLSFHPNLTCSLNKLWICTE